MACHGGEIYVRTCKTCRMSYYGETGRTAVERNRQHDRAISTGAAKTSALAWHAQRYGHMDFEEPLVIRRVPLLRKRRFIESLYGHLCPPSLSINMDCDSAFTGDVRSPGLLWKIDQGWVIVGFSQSLLDKALERASQPRRTCPKLCLHPPPPPVPIVKPKVRRWVPVHREAPLNIGDVVWVVFAAKVYKATLLAIEPYKVRYSDGSVEVDVPRWSLKAFCGEKPNPWSNPLDDTHSLHGASIPSAVSSSLSSSIPPAAVVSSVDPPKQKFARGKTTVLDLCKDPSHTVRWQKKPKEFARIHSERFVSCPFFRCRMCCALWCREQKSSCPYHQP